MNPDWPPEIKEQWQRIADAVEEPCGACHGGTLRLWRVTLERLLITFADRYTAITRCDQCEVEIEQNATVLAIDTTRGKRNVASFPRERDATQRVRE